MARHPQEQVHVFVRETSGNAQAMIFAPEDHVDGTAAPMFQICPDQGSGPGGKSAAPDPSRRPPPGAAPKPGRGAASGRGGRVPAPAPARGGIAPPARRNSAAGAGAAAAAILSADRRAAGPGGRAGGRAGRAVPAGRGGRTGPSAGGHTGGDGGSSPQMSQAGHAPGQVPAYLRQRKQELADEKALIARRQRELEAESECPPGTVRMSEEQKGMMLKRLEERKEAAEAELQRMPMRFDTVRVKARRQELLDEIEAIERGVAKFSRKIVFVERGSLPGVA
eukprot:TRINITY_DN9791_c0_g1_i1.p1 TRINITY_DN9791_c0_g1~~TRINITY_DN9791_c0_g1_i1.p1  ORF type:complete len:280 (+),score=37.31 TRINITY_DN9791_c0_g1_i1:96-935(+)